MGAEKRRGLRLTEGDEILSGKAERRMEGDMVGDSCKWEEQYGGRLAVKIHRKLANVKPASDGVLLISGSMCLCICIPCW